MTSTCWFLGMFKYISSETQDILKSICNSADKKINVTSTIFKLETAMSTIYRFRMQKRGIIIYLNSFLNELSWLIVTICNCFFTML